MKFGLFIPQGWRQDLTGIAPADQWQTMSDLAAHADQGSTFDSLWVYDHFHTVPEPTTEATHEAWSLIAAYAATTKRIKLGQMCTCMAYRNPAYLAKVATTSDIISGGRVQMGIGAGWYEHEWLAYGYGFPSAGDRLRALEEGVQIMEQMFQTGSATLDGKYYSVDGALNYPMPLQERIPMWIAGGGEKVTLRIAAKYAQYTNFSGDLAGFTHKSNILRGHCETQGTDFDAITRSANYNVVIGETEKDVADKLDWIEAHYAKTVPAKAASQRAEYGSGPLVGTPEQISERLTELEAAGMTYAISYFIDAAYDRSSIELYEKQVAANFLK
ncbi:LLM class F420-dependent oxidoreductase [Jonesiaceae bacterium BS-20]|uniref:LLM class F420-dependent oxidoreductase n=1 Tax=Jonesiaceae bacterium BS-20 TaxID=3120821 RepID=A0AAU7DTJ0_9MICO